MRADLKPCPFCGGEAHATNGVGEWWVSCLACFGGAPLQTSRDLAVAAWNTRAREAPVLKDKPAHMARALEWIERNEPGGIALVARAFAETYAAKEGT